MEYSSQRGAGLAHLESLAMHDCWAGLFVALGLAVRLGWRRQWWWSVLAIACGLAFREFVVIFAGLALVFAVVEHRWLEAAAWSATIALFALALLWHAHEVAQVVNAGDKVSQGWHGMLGVSGFLAAVDATSLLCHLSARVAALLACLALVGWLSLDGKSAPFVIMLIASYAIMIALFARSNTLYWGAIMNPWYLVGLCLLPRAWRQLGHAMRNSGSDNLPPDLKDEDTAIPRR